MNKDNSRLDFVREQFSIWDVDAILISSATNRRWLSHFTGSAGRLLITKKRAIVATDSRYCEQVKGESEDFATQSFIFTTLFPAAFEEKAGGESGDHRSSQPSAGFVAQRFSNS